MSGMSRNAIQRRITALLCLIGLACSAAGFMPAVACLIGSLDSDHQIVVSESAGQVEIRFHHAEQTPPVETTHDAPAALNGNARDPHRDHVMQFASTGDLSSQVSQVSAGSEIFGCVALIASGHGAPIVRSYSTLPHARPPPGETSSLVCLRSIVLLV
jgi:hypothetical protein